MNKSVLPARRIYSALLHLYPADFRREYAQELTLLFADMYRHAAAQGMRALAGLWLAVLLDLIASALAEWRRIMFNSKQAVQKWGGLASFLLVVALIASAWIYLTGNLRDALGPLTYSLGDFLYGPVWAVSLVTAVFSLREHIGDRAPRRMNLALLAAFAAACAFVAVACIRSANRHYHLIHPELHLEQSSTLLIMWATLVAGVIGTAFHFLGWAFVLIGSAGWTSARLPRLLSALYVLTGVSALFVYLLPELEGNTSAFTVIVGIWQGILLLKAGSGDAPAPEIAANQPGGA